MYLLNTSTLKIHEFSERKIPPYAILSHRWEEEEVSFRDVRKGRHEGLKGWSKISSFCRLAEAHSLEYAWVDTCCIDKSSSAELSEAVNSMYRWYENAVRCYVYMSDVTKSGDGWQSCRSQFMASVWFTRGWTLQELVAPAQIWFFDSKWNFLGNKDVFSQEILMITGYDTRKHFDPASPYACVAQIMHWASRRETERGEDTAYSLMGLFAVNMPLLYGEGEERAFFRLQLEILRQSDDESIFAWDFHDKMALQQIRIQPVGFCGLLAKSPTQFINSQNIRRRSIVRRRPYSMTNRGLHISTVKIDDSILSASGKQIYFLALNCRRKGSSDLLGLILAGPGFQRPADCIFKARRPVMEIFASQEIMNLFDKQNKGDDTNTIELYIAAT